MESRVPENQQSTSIQDKKQQLLQLIRNKASSTERTCPLSYGQRALWFLHRSAPSSSAYHISLSLRIKSQLDFDALRKSVQGLVNRHSQLRANFTLVKGEPVQVIAGFREVDLIIVDAVALTEQELEQEVQKHYHAPFNLEQDSLVRAVVFSKSEQDHVFLMVIHHIVFDGWSLWMCQEELENMYQGYANQQSARLPVVSSTYIDFIQWQQKTVSGEQGVRDWQYWQKQLAGIPHKLNLLTDHRRPPVQTYNGASLQINAGKDLSKKVIAMAKSSNVTVFSYLMAVYMVMLYRHTRQEDIVVGTPVSGRTQSEFKNVAGYFVNPVVIRQQLSGDTVFSSLLKNLHSTIFDALEHQDYPFPLLVEKLQPRRDPSYSPLFQNSFVFQKSQQLSGMSGGEDNANDAQQSLWADMPVQHYPLAQQEGQFDLELELMEIGNELRGSFKYNADLFDRTTIEEFRRQYLSLLESAVLNPNKPVLDLCLMDSNDKKRMINNWQPEIYALERPTLVQAFEYQVSQTPTATAVSHLDKTTSYAQLNSQANQLARHLVQKGVGENTFVGICLDRGIEMIVAMLAVLKAGGAYIPLDPKVPLDRLRFIVKDANMPVLISTYDMVSSSIDVSDDGEQLPLVDIEKDWPLIAEQKAQNLDIDIIEDQCAYVIYTSGSTGIPKGVKVSHENVTRLFRATENIYQFDRSDVWTLFHSFAFDFSVWEIWGALLYGGKLVVVPYDISRSPADFHALLHRENVTVLNQTPSAFRQLIQVDCNADSEPLASLRYVIFGGEALEPSSLKPWFDRYGDKNPRLINMYGITETTVHVTYREITRADLNHNQSVIGRPIADLNIYLLDEHMRPVPPGVPGEIYVSGSGVSLGYLNRPELTEQRFIKNPYDAVCCPVLYRSGDLARYLVNGDIEYLGRIDQQVKLRGFRIELGDIEAHVKQHPGISDAVAVVKGDGDNARIVSYFVAKNGESFSSSQLRHYLIDKLPEYSIPSIFLPIDGIPLTGNGKLDVRALPDASEVLSAGENSIVLPRDNLERELLQMWQDVLQIRSFGIQEDFFNLGGHSLLAVRLMADIEKRFKISLPVSDLFQYGSVEKMAERLRQSNSDLEWSPLVTIQSQGEQPPLFCVPGGGGNVLYFYGLSKHLGNNQPVYALQSIGLDGERDPLTSVEDIAEALLHYVRQVQPSGPYYLCGHCIGAFVAFEIACLLKQQGETIAFLGVIDAPAPTAGNQMASPLNDESAWVIILASIIEQSAGVNLEIDAEKVVAMSVNEQLEYLKAKMEQCDFLPPDSDVKHVRGLLNVFKANSQLSYTPDPREKTVSGMAMFRAGEYHRDYDYQSDDRGLGWEVFSSDPLKVSEVDGNHITMMFEPHVSNLAKHIKSEMYEHHREIEPSVDVTESRSKIDGELRQQHS